ncbi:MAG: 4'-phosphopantetheinyl transferase superfamily protein [Flavobacteriales bacterium]|nr:4'-phosphopantetheinyl transferase superfamily protein [Flavobacteriales bacterium]
MPLSVQLPIKNNHQLLVIWHLSESTEDLIALMPDPEGARNALRGIVLEKRQREWLAARLLLARFASGSVLRNLPNGKPVIGNGQHISISHCDDFAGLILGSAPVGLDMQNLHPTILKIFRKFSNELEIEDAQKSPDKHTYFTIIWSVKEAIFKFFGERVTFSEDIAVKTFNITDDLIFAEYQGEHGNFSFEIGHVFMNGYHVLYTQSYMQRMMN